MIISDFTVPELEYFRAQCNFVNLEVPVFEGRAKGECIEQIADRLHISADYARQISRKVNKKILKVL